jgi:hypothetical protein
MSTYFKLFLSILFLSSILFSSCEKQNENLPTIIFKTSTGYISADTTISAGSQIKIGITAKSNGDDNLTNFKVTSNDTTTLFDEGFNVPDFDKDITIIKNSLEIEVINITISDISGKKASLSFTITKAGENWGNILEYSFLLGGQSNTTTGSFVSLQNGVTYMQDEAFNNQTLIDLCYYYASATDLATIASPGANLSNIYSGTTDPVNWTIKNTTYFSRNIVNMNVEMFDTISNDKFIIANMTTTSEGGRKAKNLVAGNIYAFVNQAGKNGLLKVINQTGSETGDIEFVIKIQK